VPQGFAIEPPVVISIITCDEVSTSIISQKPSFLGVWDDISVPQFPAPMAITVVVSLAGVREQVDLQMYIAQELPNLAENITAFGPVSVVQPPPNNGLFNTVVVHSPYVFPAPGRYNVRIVGNGTFLAYKPLILRPPWTEGQPT